MKSKLKIKRIKYKIYFQGMAGNIFIQKKKLSDSLPACSEVNPVSSSSARPSEFPVWHPEDVFLKASPRKDREKESY